MIFGNLSSVLENEETLYDAVNRSTRVIVEAKSPSKWSSLLTNISHYGMNYNKKVYQNMIAIPADKNLQPKDDIYNQSLYGGMMNNWKSKPEEDKAFREKTLEQKREILRKMAMQPEIEDILDIMANECIVYDDNETYVAEPYFDTAVVQQLNEKAIEELRNAVDTGFYKLYMLLEWKNKCWDIFKRWLVDGMLAYEIIYDDLENPHTIIGIVDIDPATLTKSIDQATGITYWIQFKDVIGRERKMLDAQIIYIKYEDTGVSERQSYLERLIRPFNIYRIIEQAQVIWTVTQSSFKTMFTIPVGGMNKAKGRMELSQAMNRYKEDISFNAETGELKVNGRTNLPFNKEYWMPENENGTPQIETLVDNGPQLNDSDQLKYHLSKLYKMSKIPETRFDKEAQQTWFGSDPTSTLRDEINFGRFVSRLRNNFSNIMLKPLRILISIMLPNLKNDKRILEAISLRWNSYNQFEEMMNIEIDTKRIDFISTLKDTFVTTDSEGNEESYFAMKFLITRYLKMTDADIEFNEKCKLEEKLAKKKEGNGEDEEGDEGDNENPANGGDESTEGPENDEESGLDDEMLGDVQAESTETTQKD
ncbi:MAG: portal protein [Clostridia bacterium]|nr:portal protein [Clostridia bacterium]